MTEQVENRSVVKKALAELGGTFVLCLVIFVSSIYAAFAGSKVSPVNSAIAVGLAVYFALVIFGKKSDGGDFNPAITLFKVITKKLDLITAGFYFVAQFVGSALAALLLFLVMPEGGSWSVRKWLEFATNGFGSASPAADTLSSLRISFTWPIAFLLEFIAVVIILAVVNKVLNCECETSKKNTLVALAFSVGILLTQAITGGGLNPFRSLSIAIFANDYSKAGIDWPLADVWVFVLAPFVAAFLFGLIVNLVNAEKTPKPPKEPKVQKPAKVAAVKPNSANQPESGITNLNSVPNNPQPIVQPAQNVTPIKQAAPSTKPIATPEEILKQFDDLRKSAES